MKILVKTPDKEFTFELFKDKIKLGRAPNNDIVLVYGKVSREHCLIEKKDGNKIILKDLGSSNGTFVNGKRISEGIELKAGDTFFIADIISVTLIEDKKERDSNYDKKIKEKEEGKEHEKEKESKSIKKEKAEEEDKAQLRPGSEIQPTPRSYAEVINKIKVEVNKRIYSRIDLRKFNIEQMSEESARAEIGKHIDEILKEMELNGNSIESNIKERVKKELLDELLGLGPLEDFLADPTISEIMVNGPNQVYIERNGKLILTDYKFSSDEAVRRIIDRIVLPLGRRIDESMPLVDARLKDGSRVNAVIPPICLNGPTITIRKFSKRRLTPDDLIRFKSLSPGMLEFLKICVRARKNIIISGGTGSGKTTLLNILSSFIPEDERIITVEDAAELQLQQPHWVRLESRPPNIEGKGEITIRDLVRNCLRMRPDRIVVGECRGGEALDMLQAMNTGHDGSMTTLHANNPRDALLRLETLVLMAGFDLPVRAIRAQIAAAVDIIVQQQRLKDGSRKVVQISEITGMEGDTIVMQDIFKFEEKGLKNGKIYGVFKPTGVIPKFIQELKETGWEIDYSIFEKEMEVEP